MLQVAGAPGAGPAHGRAERGAGPGRGRRARSVPGWGAAPGGRGDAARGVLYLLPNFPGIISKLSSEAEAVFPAFPGGVEVGRARGKRHAEVGEEKGGEKGSVSGGGLG